MKWISSSFHYPDANQTGHSRYKRLKRAFDKSGNKLHSILGCLLSSYQHRNSHNEYKTVLLPYYLIMLPLSWEYLYLERWSQYWQRAQASIIQCCPVKSWSIFLSNQVPSQSSLRRMGYGVSVVNSELYELSFLGTVLIYAISSYNGTLWNLQIWNN